MNGSIDLPCHSEVDSPTIFAALLGLLFVVSTVGHGADSGVAYSGLSQEDEAAVVAKLKDAKITYELADGGVIRVPNVMEVNPSVPAHTVGPPRTFRTVHSSNHATAAAVFWPASPVKTLNRSFWPALL